MKEDYVYYCKKCLSLAMKNQSGYITCADCGSEEEGKTYFDDWDKKFKEEYGVSYLDLPNKHFKEIVSNYE